jgi:hypothetical protein
VIAVAERTRYIGRIRNLARQVAQLYLQQREALGFPLQELVLAISYQLSDASFQFTVHCLLFTDKISPNLEPATLNLISPRTNTLSFANRGNISAV